MAGDPAPPFEYEVIEHEAFRATCAAFEDQPGWEEFYAELIRLLKTNPMAFAYIRAVDVSVATTYKTPLLPALSVYFRVGATQVELLWCEESLPPSRDRRLAY